MIISKQNPTVKYLQKLLKKKYRDQENKFLIFGTHMIDIAEKNGYEIDVYTSDETKEGTHVSKDIMKMLSPTETPYDTIGVVNKKTPTSYSDKILILDEIQDPGNVGTLIRSAMGFGFMTVISSFDTADFYSDKTVRATQGTILYANLVKDNLDHVFVDLIKQGYEIIMSSPHAQLTLEELDVKKRVALVLGNEGAGINPNYYKYASKIVKIQTNHIESLNVGMAGSIMMHHLKDSL